jgi:predicted TIM-barrel fold metal-dependent hydrolase
MKTLDAHVHAFPDELAGRAAAALEKLAAIPMVAAPTVACLLGEMDAAGVDAAVLCCVATRPAQNEGILAWCRGVRCERIVPFPSVHPGAPDAEAHLRRIAAEGFRGIKVHGIQQQHAVDDPRWEGIYAAAEQLELVIQFHCGRDFGFPADDRASPARLARVAGRHRRLRMLCAHMGGWRMWDESDRHLVGRENVYFETSYSLGELGPRRAADMIRRHGAGRVLFGTDWPWARHADGLALLDGLGLGDDELEAIRWHNAAALLSL